MDDKLKSLYQQHYQLIGSIRHKEEDLDYSILANHLPFLQQLDVLESSSITVFDLYKKEHVYISRKIETVLGYDIDEAIEKGNTYFDEKIHPDDLLILLTEGMYFIRLGLQTALEDRKNYKFISDYRVLNGKGEYVRVIEQKLMLELDKSGNFWLALCLMDVSPDQDLSTPCRNRLINLKTGELFTFRGSDEKMESSPLTRREKEILHLISNGLLSKQIADRLFISVNTVNTHRQRIIGKLNAVNTAAAVNYAMRTGIL